MVTFLLFLLNLLGLAFKSKSQLAAENAALRQEVIVLQRKVRFELAIIWDVGDVAIGRTARRGQHYRPTSLHRLIAAALGVTCALGMSLHSYG